MGSRRICRALAGAGLVLSLAAPLGGQNRRFYLSRTVSDRAPSMRVGQLQGVGDIRTSYGPTPPSAPGGVARLRAGLFARPYPGARMPPPALAPAVMPGRAGPLSAMVPAAGLPTVRPGVLRSVSGLNRALSYWNPLVRTQWNYVPQPKMPLHAPEPREASFLAFFDLRPESAARPGPAEAARPLSEAMSAQTTRDLARLKSRAREYFKQATAAEAAERSEKLARTIDLCLRLVEIDRDAYMPLVLATHAALEREQQRLAGHLLLRAVWRHPELFKERPDLASYYGDRRRLGEQMRNHLRVGDEHPDSSQAYALQAYCAWVLGDQVRAREALARADELSRGKPERFLIEALKAAMEAALR